MKNSNSISSLFKLLLVGFCLTNSVNLNAAPPDSVVLKARLDNCSSLDSFALYESDGVSLRVVRMVFSPVAGSGEWEARLPKSAQPYILYYGKNNEMRQLKPIFIGTEPLVTLTGGCFDPTTTSAASNLNASYESARQRNDELKRESNRITRQIQQAQDPEQRKSAEANLAVSDKQKIKFLDSLKRKQPFLGKILSVDVYTSYQNSPDKGNFKDEIDYFVQQYFQYANLMDSDFNQIPQLTDAFRNYTGVLVLPGLKLSAADQKRYLEAQLNKIPANTRAYKFALSGVVVSLLERRNSEAIVYFGEKYLKLYGKDDPQVGAAVADAVSQFKSSMLGVEAPEIVQADTSGRPLSLSSLRGKIVMIDFWASWCGPCRRDNPHVVGLYEKYKNKGFDIFSVSLDQNRDRWIQAIKDDRLSWSSHVSDLKYWQNEAAKLYGVRSVPSTVLLDQNGVIIARNLRGEELDKKLKEIFGE